MQMAEKSFRGQFYHFENHEITWPRSISKTVLDKIRSMKVEYNWSRLKVGHVGNKWKNRYFFLDFDPTGGEDRIYDIWIKPNDLSITRNITKISICSTSCSAYSISQIFRVDKLPVYDQLPNFKYGDAKITTNQHGKTCWSKPSK